MLGAVVSGPDDIIDYWFGSLVEGFADDAHRRRWFTVDAARDADIKQRFGDRLQQAARGELDRWADSVSGSLALVLLCDQFARQIHRGTARAFATDPRALATARSLIGRGDDRTLPFDYRVFLYLPFEHGESRIDQHTCVGLFSALREEVAAPRRDLAENYLRYAVQHRDIVLRFGRFPHRNALLGRPDTPEEVAFLASAGDFGQRAAPPEEDPQSADR